MIKLFFMFVCCTHFVSLSYTTDDQFPIHTLDLGKKDDIYIRRLTVFFHTDNLGSVRFSILLNDIHIFFRKAGD